MPLRIVQPGMMIDQAIIDRAGRVLIVRRTPLEDFHIDALKKMGVTGIYTCEGTEDVKPAEADQTQQLPEPLQKKYDQVKVKDPAKVQISESVRSRVAQGVQYLYQDTQSPDFTNASFTSAALSRTPSFFCWIGITIAWTGAMCGGRTSPLLSP